MGFDGTARYIFDALARNTLHSRRALILVRFSEEVIDVLLLRRNKNGLKENDKNDGMKTHSLSRSQHVST